MENSKQITILILLGIFHLIVSMIFSKIVFEREPSIKKRVLLIGLLWLVPVLGVLSVYKILDLGWFKNPDGSKGSGAVSIGLLEMDSVFNPGARHLIEAKQKERVEVQKEGEMVNKPDFPIDSLNPNSDKK